MSGLDSLRISRLKFSRGGSADTEQDWFLVSRADNLGPSDTYDVILGESGREGSKTRGWVASVLLQPCRDLRTPRQVYMNTSLAP